MRSVGFLGALLILVASSAATGFERPAPTPAAHEEFGQFLEQLPAQLHDFTNRWWPRLRERIPLGERPLVTIMLQHRDDLGLSAAQVHALDKLKGEFERESIRRQADIRVTELELEELLKEDAVDLAKAEEKVRKLERLNGDQRLARVKTIERAKAELTPAQLAKLKSLLEEPRAKNRAESPSGEKRMPRADRAGPRYFL